MKLTPFIITVSLAMPLLASAQGAVDALPLTRSDLRGTARYMSMGGAFGALGGDLTTLSQNPAGIGVYRSHEVGFTLNLDAQHASSESGSMGFTTDKTHFYLNNIGGVLTLKLNSSAVPNLNFGFTYNKTASFNRTYQGSFGNISNSMTNYMAGMSNADGVTVGDVTMSDYYNPYNPTDGGFVAPWMSILAYQSWFINPIGDENHPNWEGQWGDSLYDAAGNKVSDGTSGTAEYSVNERGSIDSFNIALGGNIGNVVFWGMDFDISNINYTRSTYYAEDLTNAYVMGDQGIEPVSSKWDLCNYYNVSGTGFTYKLGVIVKPIQELRIGFAFHTPTYYSLNQTFSAYTDYSYNGEPYQSKDTNYGVPGSYSYRLRSPWRIMASVAGVIGNNFIISADYEWAQYSKMRFSDPGDDYYYYDDWYMPPTIPAGPQYDSYDVDGTNDRIGQYFQNTNTFRIGAEFRVTPSFSIRAGYCNVSSPVKAAAKDGKEVIYTAGTQPGYTFYDSTNYITAGLGYRYKHFYADLAYVYKHINATYHAFTDDPMAPQIPSPKAKLGLKSNQVVLSMGFKF